MKGVPNTTAKVTLAHDLDNAANVNILVTGTFPPTADDYQVLDWICVSLDGAPASGRRAIASFFDVDSNLIVKFLFGDVVSGLNFFKFPGGLFKAKFQFIAVSVAAAGAGVTGKATMGYR